MQDVPLDVWCASVVIDIAVAALLGLLLYSIGRVCQETAWWWKRYKLRRLQDRLRRRR